MRKLRPSASRPLLRRWSDSEKVKLSAQPARSKAFSGKAVAARRAKVRLHQHSAGTLTDIKSNS